MTAMKYLQNLHTHSTFCDGKNSLTEMAEKAIELGFDSIGFSMHSYMPFSNYFKRTPEEAEENCRRYRAEAYRLKELYRDRLAVFVGEEVEMFSDVEKKHYDYLIGSVHYLKIGDEYVGFDRDVPTVQRIVNTYFDGDGMAFARAYYATLAELPTHNDFDIIGHFDIHAKLNEAIHMFDEGSKEYLSLAYEALDALKGKIPYAEINTGAIARGYRSVPYPILPILKEMKRRGFGILFTSDCHNKDDLACYYKEAEALAKEAGFGEYYVLKQNGFVPMPLD